jgi:hypothetical protein
MGFWEEQGEDSNGVRYLTSAEFDELKEASAIVSIAAVSQAVPDEKFGGERFIVTFIPKGSDETVKYGFRTGQVDSRDRNLVAMRGYIAENGPVEARLAPAGRGVTFTAV